MCVKYDSEPSVLIDLRNKLPPIRDQGSRPLCLVFAASDLNTFIHNEKEAFSVEYLSYYSYKEAGKTDYSQGLTFQAVSQALEKYGQPYEKVAPYNVFSTKPSIPSVAYKNLFFAEGKKQLDLVDDLIKSLDKGCAVIIITKLTPGFFSPIKSNVIDDEIGNTGNHALIVVGYGEYADKEVCFLIRNSWGESWANSGHAWLTSKFISNRTFMSLRLSKIS